MKLYDVSPSFYSDDTKTEALEWAAGFDFGSCETTERDNTPAHSDYIESVQGVGVWYCYGADHYFFEDETEGNE